MTAEGRRVAREIYLEARSLPAGQQAEFIARECGGDASLREEVQVMFDSIIDLPSASSGLSSLPVPDSGDSPSTAARAQVERIQKLSEQSNTSLRYEIQEEIGRGGQGAILRVFDKDLRRTLAMKVIRQRAETKARSSTQVDSGVLARFLEEAQITGQLDHPGVIPVHELGVDSNGRVYFTMRLVKGRELRQIIRQVHDDDSEWTLTRSLGVLLKVCEAMAYAHDKGVVHRDLKPANVMVGKYGEVYVMDWGLARVAGRADSHDIRLQHSLEFSLTVVETDRKEAKDESMNSPLVTMDGAVVGTPFYMPPEQACGRVEEVSARSDVYAVGAMLYHLLTGREPYFNLSDRQLPHTVLAQVLEGPPTPLHDLAPNTPAELEAICEKAMARESSERYADMGELGEDLRAFLEGRVVQAYRSGALAEFRKWVGRNRGMATSLAAAVLILVIGLFSSSLLYVEARESGERAVRQSYVAGILAAEISFQRGRILEARSYLDECAEPLRNWEWYYLKQRTDGGLTEPADLGSPVTAVAYTADGASVVLGTEDGRVSVRSADTGAEVITLADAHASEVVAVAWSSDGSRVLSLGGLHDRRLCVWDAVSGRTVQVFQMEVDARCAAFDEELSKLAVGTSGNIVHVFSLGDELSPLATLEGHTGSVLAVAFVPGGEHLLSGAEDRTVRLWSLTEEDPPRIHLTSSAVHGLSVHPDGSEYAAGLEGGKITRWSRETGEPLGTLAGHMSVVYALSYAPDGQRLASTSLDRSVRVWGVAGSTLLATLWGHDKATLCLAFRPDGFHLASGSMDGKLRLWSSHSDGAVDSWTNPQFQEYISAALFDAGSEHVLVGSSWNANLELVDVERGESILRRPGPEDAITSLAQSPDGSLVAVALEEAWEIRVWDHPSGRERPTLTGHEATIHAICFTADGERIVSASEDGTLRIWPAIGGESGPPLAGHTDLVNAVAASRDGTWIASGSDDGTVRLWDQATGRAEGVLVDVGEPVYSIAIDPQGRRLAFGHGEGEVDIFDFATDSRQHMPAGHDHRVASLAFSPDGLRLVTGSNDRTLGIWHVEAARHLLTLRGHTREVTSVAFSPDGTQILSTSMDGTVRLWAGRPEIR